MDHAPVLPADGPLFCNVHHRQIQHFEQAVVRRENRFRLCHLAELTVEALNRVRRVNQPAHLLRILKIGAQIWPVFLPRGRNLGMFLVLMLRKNVQGFQSGRLVYSGINRLQVGHQGFPIFGGNIFRGIADLMDHAVLNLCFRKDCLNCCGKTGQVVRAGNEDIFYAVVPDR